MKLSIRSKLLSMCLGLVLLTIVSLSTTYYWLTRQDKQRESRQRIRIAFDIILRDAEKRIHTYQERFEEFLDQNITILAATYAYTSDESEWGTIEFLYEHFAPVAEELKTFGRVALADRMALYGANKRLLVVYRRLADQETVGGYLESEDEGKIYLEMEDPGIQAEIFRRGLEAKQGYYFKPGKLAETPLPAGVSANYAGAIPDAVEVMLFTEGAQLGIRIMAPIYRRDQKIGVLMGDVFYTQDMVAEYATLSKTAVNFFVDGRQSLGTFPEQTELTESEALMACNALLLEEQTVELIPFTQGSQDYYQGRCALSSAGQTVGAITVSLSQEIEKREIRKIITAVVIISAIVGSVAFGFAILFSRTTIQAIHEIVAVIVAASDGDLRRTATARTHDEIGMLAVKSNQMIAQLRSISAQVQQAAYAVNETADSILRQMETLVTHMEQQSASVDNTTSATESIQHFIDTVAHKTSDLLAASSEVLASIQEMRASIEEVTTSTGSLTTNLHLISSAVDQVNGSAKQIAGNTRELVEAARRTEGEAQHIDHSFQEISHNADQTQLLAKETMDAAIDGKTAVEASIQGMIELKAVVANSAQIIQEVNVWGERVSSILDIVDEITRQTTLLALNASIISAQAGAHGRGFAVVAGEIKNLAARTQDSTKEISGLIHELRGKTQEGVTNIEGGIRKTNQSVELAHAVQDALTTILERATRSSNRAADTADIIQQTVSSSQIISASMGRVTNMVASMKQAVQEQEQDIERVVAAVENISGMSEQVNRANLEQKSAANQITTNMEHILTQFGEISDQTELLKQNSQQIVSAMHTIETTTAEILRNTTSLSGETVKNLVQQSDMLQKIVTIFKVT